MAAYFRTCFSRSIKEGSAAACCMLQSSCIRISSEALIPNAAIFYKSVIEGNRNSVIMLEEIEAHSYPPYISKVTNCILDDESNQYFITTHSPYVVNDFLEKKDKDVAIYLVDLQDGKNIVRKLSDNELEEVYDDGIDLFFNGDMFLK